MLLHSFSCGRLLSLLCVCCGCGWSYENEGYHGSFCERRWVFLRIYHASGRMLSRVDIIERIWFRCQLFFIFESAYNAVDASESYFQ